MRKVIQISVSNTEHAELERQAKEHGLSISRYIISQILPDNEFKKWYPELLLRVSKLESGTIFNIREVFATDWKDIPKGIKLALGRVFYKNVSDKNVCDDYNVANIEILDKNDTNIQWYEKH
ncbi:MAG: single-stranded DNA-binding protein [Oscillospiraceae bacterium]|nr:single-stranded DNA-binding protein [Oscillospiraceae bacterium]